MSSSAACLVDPSDVAPLRPLPASGTGRAERSAYEAGFEDGRAGALAEVAGEHEAAIAALRDAAKALRCAAEQLAEARSEATKVGVHEAMGLAVEVVEALVGSIPANLDATRLSEALALAPVDEIALVRLNPGDAETALSFPVDAKVVADETVERGGCIVEVGPTRIDAQVGPAIARLRALLAGGQAS